MLVLAELWSGNSRFKNVCCRYVENGSLANIIKPNKFGPFPESLVAVYIAQVYIYNLVELGFFMRLCTHE